MAREDVCEPRSIVMKHEEPKDGLKSGLVTRAVGLWRQQQTSKWGENLGTHPSTGARASLAWGHLSRAWDGETARRLQVKGVSRQERGNGVDSH